MAILPYIEQVVLFNEFALDEPWDSPRNIELLRTMPYQYESPRKNNKPGETFYQVFTGPATAFPNPGGGSVRHPIRFSKPEQYGSPPSAQPVGQAPLQLPLFKDCADQLLVVEAASSVPWTKPEDLPYDPQGSLPRLGGIFGEGQFFGVFGNSSPHWFSHPSQETLRVHILGKK